MQRLPISIHIPLFIVLFFVIFIQKSFAQLDETKYFDELRKLNWHNQGTYHLDIGNASITITSEEALVLGEDARKFSYMDQGHKNFSPNAVIVRVSGPAADTSLYYSFIESGYLTTTDWDEYIDKNELLKEIKKNTERDNKIKKSGYPNLYVDGWKQEPILDKSNSVVYWAISAHTDKGEKIVNAKAIKLARKGFTTILWMGSDKKYISAKNSLQPALNSYQYNDGYTYADYKPSIDKLAPIGIGALAYTMISGKSGSKLTKAAGAGLLGLLAVFAKKLWFLIFIPFVFAWKWLKRLFTGGKDSI